MLQSIEGIYQAGKIELAEIPPEVDEGTRVIVTFLRQNSVDLRARGFSEADAAGLRARLSTFAEDWDLPEMNLYDNYDAAKANL